jgi:hypothetical protein
MKPTTILRWATRDSFLVCLQADFGRLNLKSIDSLVRCSRTESSRRRARQETASGVI